MGVNCRSLFTSQVLDSYCSRNSHSVKDSDSLYCQNLEILFDGAGAQKGSPIAKTKGHVNITTKKHSNLYK